jgi:hypothetical protein
MYIANSLKATVIIEARTTLHVGISEAIESKLSQSASRRVSRTRYLSKAARKLCASYKQLLRPSLERVWRGPALDHIHGEEAGRFSVRMFPSLV